MTNGANTVGSGRKTNILGENAQTRWVLLLDAIVIVLVLLMLFLENAGQLFKVVFFVLTIGTFFWDLRTFVMRGAFWVSLTTVVLAGAFWTGRVPALEFLDIPYFLAVLVLVFTVSKRRAETQLEVERLLAVEQQRTQRLSDVAELKADFTAMVVHELGNPISALRRLTEMLRFEGLDGEVKEYVLDSIRGELGSLDALVADVQTAVAVEREDFQLDIRPVPLEQLLEDAGKYGRSVTGERHFETVADDLAEGQEVLADPDRFAQVLRNLLSNAAKYSPADRPIELRAKAGLPGRIRIEVADEGRGISPEDLDRVFEKFGRGVDARGGKIQGAGLGLYISRRLVRAHHSELTVTSEPDKGSVFGFELPVAGPGAPADNSNGPLEEGEEA
ncbi:MAG: sensor histidine kinase [Rubrobacteraceae bacterium]